MKPGCHICTETVRVLFRKHLQAIGMGDEGFTLHSLRHAFGMHLFDAGVDLLIIKEAMGHKSLKSTEIYLKMGIGNGRKVTSPLDLRP